ncbi:MAG TPA: tetratricopeptide repeat protein [Terriglobales bacterium]
MYRSVALVFAGLITLSADCVAQNPPLTRQNNPAFVSHPERERPARELRRERTALDLPGAIQQIAGQSISLVRLRVPQKARGFFEKGRKAFGKHQYSEAQKKLNQALQACPAFPEALTMAGYIQMSLNQWGAAEQSLQTAVRTDPSYGLARIVLADLYNAEKRFGDALAAAQQAVASIPHSWVLEFEMARAHLGEHQYELAVSVSDDSLRKNRGTLLHVVKAHALIALHRYPEAVTELRTYLQYQPQGDLSQDAHQLLDQIQSATTQ